MLQCSEQKYDAYGMPSVYKLYISHKVANVIYDVKIQYNIQGLEL